MDGLNFISVHIDMDVLVRDRARGVRGIGSGISCRYRNGRARSSGCGAGSG